MLIVGIDLLWKFLFLKNFVQNTAHPDFKYIAYHCQQDQTQVEIRQFKHFRSISTTKIFHKLGHRFFRHRVVAHRSEQRSPVFDELENLLLLSHTLFEDELVQHFVHFSRDFIWVGRILDRSVMFRFCQGMAPERLLEG